MAPLSADGVPPLHFTETNVKAHAAFPSECEMVWTTFLSRYTKNIEAIETEHNLNQIMLRFALQ